MSRLLGALLFGLSALGCTVDDPLPPPGPSPSKPVTADLALDIRDTAHLVLPRDATPAQLTLSKGFGVLPAGAALQAVVAREAFPEADTTLYVATFAAMGDASGPCGAGPVSLHLTLRRRAKNLHVGGGLVAYCGAGVESGTPARVLRLGGDLPLEE